VAEENGRIVGFADGGKERSHPESGEGELYAIYILKEFQGRGIGKALMKEAVRSLTGSGMNSMVTWALEKSPYLKFYETVGGKRAPGFKKLDLGGNPILLVSYVWEKLA
jgi:GNAT superfamily N-acetyltransferase